MPNSRVVIVVTCLLLLAVIGGCANPARDKPEAEVTEPGPSPVPSSEGTRFVLAEGSKIGFVGSKVTGSHDGGFNEFEGEILLVDGDPTKSSVQVSIVADSIWADNERLTGHLKSPDFFDVATYPTATFATTSITEAEEGYTITGNLDLHGVTKSISFPANITVEADRITTEAEFFINRFDFEIKYPGRPDDLIREEVVIKLDLVATPAA